jgi:GMP synthase (glutamine-hydrolysing)
MILSYLEIRIHGASLSKEGISDLDKKILSIQNISFETLDTLSQLIRSDGYQVENIEAQEEAVPNNVEQYAAIIILGGPIAVYDNVKYLDKEQELIKHALKREIPVLGICLGSQLIAQVIGGNVYKGGKRLVQCYCQSSRTQGPV